MYALLRSLRSEANGAIAERSPIDVEQVVKDIEKINETTSRNDRLASWKQFPLSSSADLERWRAETENLQQSRNDERREPTLHRQISNGFHGEYQDEPPGQPIAPNAAFSDSVANVANELDLISPVGVVSRLASSDQRKYF